MRKILILSLALVLVVGIMSHGTSSYFSDTETGGVTISTALEWEPCYDCGAYSDPVVTSVPKPPAGAVYRVGDWVKIEWCIADVDCIFPLTIDIDFSRYASGDNFGYHIVTLQQNSPGCDFYMWQIPYDAYLISDTCRIRVTATDPCGSDFGISAIFCPELPLPPEVTVITPNGGDSWQAGESHYIAWTTEGVFPEIMLIDVYLSVNDGDSWIKIISDEENDGLCLWEVPAGIPTSDAARIKVVAKYPFELIGQDDSDEAFSLLGLEPPPSEPGLNEAYNLVVDKSAATLTADGEIACDIDLNNSGEDDITIDKLVISWEVDIEHLDMGDSRLVEIWSANELEYVAELLSGLEWDISDMVLTPGEGHSISLIISDGEAGETINLEFIMSDGSIVTVYLEQYDEE